MVDIKLIEFDYGCIRTAELMDKTNSSCKYLGSNIRDTATRNLFHTIRDYDTFEVKTRNGIVKVGVFGVCTEQTPRQSHPTDAVTFENVVAHAERCVNILKYELSCDVIVCLSHVKLSNDKCLAEIEHIDVIIGGHDHDPYILHHHNTLIVKCGMNLDYLGIVDLDLSVIEPLQGARDSDMNTDSCIDDIGFAAVSHNQPKHANHVQSEGRKVSLAHSIQLLSSESFATDPNIDSIIQYWTALTVANNNKNGPVDEVICSVGDGSVLSSLTNDMRTQESAFGCLVADAMLYCYRDDGCDMALINGGFVRNNMEYVPGQSITRGDIQEELPFKRCAVLIEIKGSEFRLGLEQMLAQASHPTGAFPHLSNGLKVTYNLSESAFSRIQQIKVHDEDLNPERVYRVAVSEFYVRTDGDGVTAFQQTIVKDYGIFISEEVIHYFKKLETVFGKNPNRLIRC